MILPKSLLSPCRSNMGPRLSIIGVCLLPLLTAFATATQYSDNATNLVSSEDLESPFPYYFPNQINTDNLFPMPRCNGVTLEEATVDQLQDAMSKGQLTSTNIAECYVQRIQQTNQYIKYEQKPIFPTSAQFLPKCCSLMEFMFKIYVSFFLLST